MQAQERVLTVRETEVVERRKAIELVEATQHAEAEAVRVQIQVQAEKNAAIDRAEATRLRNETVVDGKRLMNEAENMRSDSRRRSALHVKLVEDLPAIIRESVEPMESIESIRILHVDGVPGLTGAVAPGGETTAPTLDGSPRGGNFADSVVNSALRYRAQAPFVDALLQEIGMAPGAISTLANLPVPERPKPAKDAE